MAGNGEAATRRDEDTSTEVTGSPLTRTVDKIGPEDVPEDAGISTALGVSYKKQND